MNTKWLRAFAQPVVIQILASALLTPTITAQEEFEPGKLQKRIEDFRKVKLLDILDLQDNQVEKFFAVYNKHQKRHEQLRLEIDAASKELQHLISTNASEAVLLPKVEELRKLIREMGKEIEQRFDDVKPVLTPSQYAQYVVFESRFRDELQRLIIDRIKQRDQRGKR